MITETNAYGIRLTDEFGGFYKEFKKISKFNDFKNLDSDLQPLELYDICESCPSDEDRQYVLGIHALFNRHTNLPEIHKNWLHYMENLPQSIKDILEEIKKENSQFLEPDFYTMSGNC